MTIDTMTLKLDSAYKPIEIISWQDAISLVITGKAYVVESYETLIRSAKEAWKVPAVIVLKQFIKLEYLSFSCTRKNILLRDDYTCQYCAKRFCSEKLTLDHVIPRSRNGQRSWTNIVAACQKCNQRKGNMLTHEVKMFPINKPIAPNRKFLIKFLSAKLKIDVKNYI
jgi:5-methylcytosine-specific restriction endonuclease McrA